MTEPAPGKSGSLGERNGSAAPAPDIQEEIQRHIRELLSEDYTVRAASITELEKYGEDAAEALIDTLIKKAGDPSKFASFSDALVEIGKPSVSVILHALNHIVDIKRTEDVYLLESFLGPLGLLQDRRAIPPLTEHLAKLNAAIKRNHNKQLVHCAESAKVLIHRLLIELGERSGVDDLLEMLGDGRTRVREGVVDSLARVGDKRALVPLVRLYEIEEPVSYSGAQVIKEAVREIARRENVTPEDRSFKKELTAEERAGLERLFPKTKNGNGKH